jgi:hypothetical protein
MCLPPSHLDEDNWTLEGASSCRYPPNTIETVLKFGIYSSPVKDGNPLLRSGVVVHNLVDAGPNPFLPLVANATRGARHSDNIWKEPQNLDAAYMQFSFFILLTAGCFCALLRWTDAALAMLALAILTRGAFQVAIAVLIDTNPVSIRNVDDPYASAHWWVRDLAKRERRRRLAEEVADLQRPLQEAERERELLIGTQFSDLDTTVDTPAEAEA